MAYDVNTLTVKGAELLAAATAQDKLILDGCDATTVYITQANAQLVESRPVSPLSTTTTVSIIGYTSNHVVARAEFNAGVNTGGDARTLYLYGHKESAPSDVYVIYVASDMDTFHLPVAGDVATQYETLFDMIYAVNPDAVETASTSIFTTLAEFNMLKERTVTTHKEGELTIGEPQTIYGTKTFKGTLHAHNALGLLVTLNGSTSSPYCLINPDRFVLYSNFNNYVASMAADGTVNADKAFLPKTSADMTANPPTGADLGSSTKTFKTAYTNELKVTNMSELTSDSSWINFNYDSITYTSSVNIETQHNNSINLAYNFNGNGSFDVKLNNTSMFSIYYNGADQEYQTSIDSPLKVPEIRLTDDVITIKPGQITGTGDINIGKLTIHGSNLGCSVAIMEQLVNYMAGMSVSLNSSSVGEYHAYARGTTGVGSNGAELIMHHADTFANTNNEIILGLWNTNDNSWDGFSCEYDSVATNNVITLKASKNVVDGPAEMKNLTTFDSGFTGNQPVLESGATSITVPVGGIIGAFFKYAAGFSTSKVAGQTISVGASSVKEAYAKNGSVIEGTYYLAAGTYTCLMSTLADSNGDSWCLLQRIS